MISLYLRNEGLYYLPDYPERPLGIGKVGCALMDYNFEKYEQAIERSKANAIRVKNQDEVRRWVFFRW
jgi:hypothetical protein